MGLAVELENTGKCHSCQYRTQQPLWSCFLDDVCVTVSTVTVSTVTVREYIKEAGCAVFFFLCCRPAQQKSHNNQPGEVVEKQLCRQAWFRGVGHLLLCLASPANLGLQNSEKKIEIYKSMEQFKTKRLILGFQYFDMTCSTSSSTCWTKHALRLRRILFFIIIITNKSNTVKQRGQCLKTR